MHIKLVIAVLIGLVLALSGVTGLQFKETITTSGTGTLYLKTNTEGARDLVQGTGDIEYARSIDSENDKSMLSSRYKLRNGIANSYKNYGSFKVNGTDQSGWRPIMPGYEPNRYLLAMSSTNRLSHAVSIYGTTDILSDSNIIFADQKVTTNYNIVASGSLQESVLDGSGGKTLSIAETSISGNGFKLNSGLTEAVPKGSDLSALVGIMNQTEMGGEKSVSETAPQLKAISDHLSMLIPKEAGQNPEQQLEVNPELGIMSVSGSATTIVNNNETGGACAVCNNSSKSTTGDGQQTAETATTIDGSAPLIIITEPTTQVSGELPKISPNYVESPQCGDIGTICMNYTHIFAIRRPGIGQPQIPPITEGGFVTYRRPVEALRGL
jgi:hypothetical protein